MSFISPIAVIQDQLITVTKWNQDVVDNVQYLYDQLGNLDAKVGYSLLASATTFSFTDLDQSFDHLMIFGSFQSNHTTFDTLLARANGDTGNNYLIQRINASNATVNASSVTASSFMSNFGSIEGDDDLDAFSPFWGIITDYSASNRSKGYLMVSARQTTTSSIGIVSGEYKSNTAITSLTFVPTTGSAFVADSSVSIIGVGSV